LQAIKWSISDKVTLDSFFAWCIILNLRNIKKW
jgi:hypothetical protein